MLADTGASSVALTAKDAQKIGINLQTLQFTGKANTANGTVPRASLLLQEVNTGGIILRNVRASQRIGKPVGHVRAWTCA
jgi:aspartyl protease family protein